jgi:hypothetical protein
MAPVAFATIGMVEHLITWFRQSGPMSVEQVAALYADLGVAMVAALPAAAGKARKSAAAKYAVA